MECLNVITAIFHLFSQANQVQYPPPPPKDIKSALTHSGMVMSWPLNEYRILSPGTVDLGQLIGSGNWGSIRYGTIKANGKGTEVAVKLPKGESSHADVSLHLSETAPQRFV